METKNNTGKGNTSGKGRARANKPGKADDMPIGVPAVGASPVVVASIEGQTSTEGEGNQTSAETETEAAPAVDVNAEKIKALESEIKALRANMNPAPIEVMRSFLTDDDGIGRKALVSALSEILDIDRSIVGARLPKSLRNIYAEVVKLEDPAKYRGDKAFDLGHTFASDMFKAVATVATAKKTEKGEVSAATAKALSKLANMQPTTGMARFIFGMVSGANGAKGEQRNMEIHGMRKPTGAKFASDASIEAIVAEHKLAV
jgi:hypothetical protein